MEAIVDLVQVFAGNTQLAKIARAANGCDHPSGAYIFAPCYNEFEQLIPSFDLFDPDQAGLDALLERLALQLLHQGFFDFGAKLQIARGHHLGRIGVYGLASGKIDHRGKGLGGFEDIEREAGLARRQGRSHTRHPGTDNGHIENNPFATLLAQVLKIAIGHHVLHRPGPRIRSKL